MKMKMKILISKKIHSVQKIKLFLYIICCIITAKNHNVLKLDILDKVNKCIALQLIFLFLSSLHCN